MESFKTETVDKAWSYNYHGDQLVGVMNMTLH